jgi:hypothetical protein
VAFAESQSSVALNAVTISLWAPSNLLVFTSIENGRLLHRKSLASPVLLSDGEQHTVTVSVNTVDSVVVFAVDGKGIGEELTYGSVFSVDGTKSYEYFVLGGAITWMDGSKGMMGELTRAELTLEEYRVPSEQWSGQPSIPSAGYGACAQYDENRFGDLGMCASIHDGRSIFVPHHGFGMVMPTIFPSVIAFLNFLPDSCVQAMVPYMCLNFLVRNKFCVCYF